MHARDVANVFKYERLENVLLVGHSYGGMPISLVPELVPEGTIQSLMYLDAFFPEDGQCLNDLVPGKPHLPPDRGGLPGASAARERRGVQRPPGRRRARGLRGTAHTPVRSSASARRRGSPARASASRRKTYVLATGYANDTFAPVASRLRQRQGWRVEEMPYTHDLQHVAVRETAAMIESAIP